MQCFEVRVVKGERPQTFQRTFSFAALTGKPCLLVNIATHCSESELNFADLQRVQEANPWLMVLAWPSDQFLGQMPEDSTGLCTYIRQAFPLPHAVNPHTSRVSQRGCSHSTALLPAF